MYFDFLNQILNFLLPEIHYNFLFVKKANKYAVQSRYDREDMKVDCLHV